MIRYQEHTSLEIEPGGAAALYVSSGFKGESDSYNFVINCLLKYLALFTFSKLLTGFMKCGRQNQ
jgi:hypothetical protein